MKDFSDKVALVTGAASGIGQALAIELAREGTHLVLADVDETGLDDTRREIEAINRKALAVRADVSRVEEVEALCARAIQEMGKIDILANVAGIVIFADIREMELGDWSRILGVNLYGSIHTIRFLLDPMIQRRSGHIVNVASSAGLVAQPGMGGYSVSKFGLVGLTETLRAEVSRYGIGVTAVCPGAVKTNIFAAAEYRNYDVRGPLSFILKHLAWPPERVARAVVRAIKKNRPMLALSAANWWGYALKRSCPSLVYSAQKAMADALVEYRITSSEGG